MIEGSSDVQSKSFPTHTSLQNILAIFRDFLRPRHLLSGVLPYRHSNRKHKTNDRNNEACSTRYSPLCNDGDTGEGKKNALGGDAGSNQYREQEIYNKTPP